MIYQVSYKLNFFIVKKEQQINTDFKAGKMINQYNSAI